MDNSVLHALKKRGKYRALRSAVPDDMMSTDTVAMLAWYGHYFDKVKDSEEVDLDVLASMIKLKGGEEDAVRYTLMLCEELKKPADESVVDAISEQLIDLDLAGKVGSVVQRYSEGEELDIMYELQRLTALASRQKDTAGLYDYIDIPIESILGDLENDVGIKFRRISMLNEHLQALNGGASIALAARPDKGKSSMLASILTDWAPQVIELYGSDRPILWFNNEGSGKRLIPRLYQAALNKNLEEVIGMSNKGTLRKAYAKAVGGDPNIIRVKDMHGATLGKLEQVIEANKPAVVVADMLGNFRLGGNVGTNKAETIELIWQEWREILVRHDCVGIGTVQISQEGANQLYPPYSAMKDSKTAVQGATDIILMMGTLEHPDFRDLRGLSTPKNKFPKARSASYQQCELYFNANTCQFEDGENATKP